ncbi:MAG: Uma2 family endonuclease [Cyanobacteria bacterium J06639_1]
MVASLSTDYVSAVDYLCEEVQSPVKREYRDGFIYNMAGASNNHVTIAGNLFALLRSHVRGSGCRVFISDTKVHVQSRNSYYYPDVVVSCDRRDREFPNFLRYPKLIVEVLSDATEAFDRGDKFADYRTLDTMAEYVLISQKHPQVEVFRHDENGQWTFAPHAENDTLHLVSVDFQCPVIDLYEDVEFPPAEPEAEH